MRILRLGFGALLGMTMPFLGAGAFAAGSGGDSGETAENCSGGQVWDQKSGKCVNPKNSGLDTDSIYEGGRDYALAGRYGEAITVLSTIASTNDPRVLNYLGYSHRMSGRVDVGLGYYEEALRLNPDFTLAREYMGEAFLQKGDLPAAQAQLGEIVLRTGVEGPEYIELKKQIDAYLRGT